MMIFLLMIKAYGELVIMPCVEYVNVYAYGMLIIMLCDEKVLVIRASMYVLAMLMKMLFDAFMKY